MIISHVLDIAGLCARERGGRTLFIPGEETRSSFLSCLIFSFSVLQDGQQFFGVPEGLFIVNADGFNDADDIVIVLPVAPVDTDDVIFYAEVHNPPSVLCSIQQRHSQMAHGGRDFHGGPGMRGKRT
jgi:hypothetical protein